MDDIEVPETCIESSCRRSVAGRRRHRHCHPVQHDLRQERLSWTRAVESMGA